MAAIIQYKQRSATLVETIVALSVSLVIFGITVAIFLQVTASSPSMQRLKAQSLLETYILRTETNKEFFDEERESQGMRIRREIVNPQNNGIPVKIKFSITADNGKNLAVEWRLLKS